MKAIGDVVLEFSYPLRSSGVLITLAFFVLMILLADAAGILGLWLLIVIFPALVRYLILLLEARARDLEPPTPGIELFSWVSSAWALFPLVPLLLAVGAVITLRSEFGTPAAVAGGVVALSILPASFGVLAITHSPLESINPLKVWRFIELSWSTYWLAPLAIFIALIVMSQLQSLPAPLRLSLELYLVFVMFGVVGAITRPHDMVDDVDIPEPLPLDEVRNEERLDRARENALTVAYGFFSRGNREGALQHLYDHLANDPDPDRAWQRVFDGMLRWDDKYPALKLGQQYVGRLLAVGEDVAALKLITRGRMINEEFRPLQQDLGKAIDAASRLQNDELAQLLKRYER